MDATDLPTGMLSLYKAATRELVLACKGAQSVKAKTGFSDGVISRWQNDAYPDTMPGWVIFLLEFDLQVPVFARAIAGLTSHTVVPIAGGEGGGDHVTDLVGFASSAAQVTQDMGSSLSDGQVTPGEAKAVLATIGRHKRTIHDAERRLTVVAARAAAGSGS